MRESLQNISHYLGQASLQYQAVVTASSFKCENWISNVGLFKEIVKPLMDQAQRQIVFCEKEIALNNTEQVVALEKRANLYSTLKLGKDQLSELDAKRIHIISMISSLSDEIGGIRGEIEWKKQEIRNAINDKKHWDTVFYGTIWIPFVNIGTGIKFKNERASYHAKIQVYGKAIDDAQDKIQALNGDLDSVNAEQKNNKATSGELANQITAVEGEIALVTNAFNELIREMHLWRIIWDACSRIYTDLEYSNGKTEVILESFSGILELEKMLILPKTEKFIKGCSPKGEMLTSGQKLKQNEFLISQNNRFVAVMQADNNFVVYHSEGQLWSSGTGGAQGAGYVELSEDGLISFKGTNFNWDTKRNGATQLIIQNDGNLVVYNKDHQALWGSDTYTYANVPSLAFSY